MKKTGIELIIEERKRQIEVEEFSTEEDAQYVCGELSDAAICYAMRGYWRDRNYINMFWPWGLEWWKPTPENRIKELAKAGALIAAEIDRLNNIK